MVNFAGVAEVLLSQAYAHEGQLHEGELLSLASKMWLLEAGTLPGVAVP